MAMNILGGGIPETHEFRFRISPMMQAMTGEKGFTMQIAEDCL
jgi:hypothetical protein